MQLWEGETVRRLSQDPEKENGYCLLVTKKLGLQRGVLDQAISANLQAKVSTLKTR